MQGEKTRCVDDFSRSHVNACAQVTEAPKPHTVDVLESLLMQAMTSSPNAEGWCVRTLDLKDAYRQCAVATSSFPFSHIVVREPSTGMPKVFKMLALPFGSIKSVHAFLRIAHSLWFLAACALDVMWTNYFDDYVCCCPRSEASHLSMTIHAFSISWDGRSQRQDPKLSNLTLCARPWGSTLTCHQCVEGPS